MSDVDRGEDWDSVIPRPVPVNYLRLGPIMVASGSRDQATPPDPIVDLTST